LDVPIVQGPFGSGLSSVELTAAVCESGGLGSFGAHHLDAQGIRDVAARIRERTKRPFALNLWIPFDNDAQPIDAERFRAALQTLQPYYQELGVPLPSMPQRFIPDYEEQVQALIEARPAVFSFVFGVPSAQILERCRAASIATVGAATTPDEAIFLERAGVDMVVASGFEAGGHRISFLRAPEESLTGTMALIPQVVDAVKIPVIAAGGIADGRGVAAALCLGAQAVQIGTAFLACDESSASSLHRAKLRSPEARYTALTRSFTGRLARGIDNRFVREMRTSPFARYPVQAWLTAQLKKAALEQGRTDLISLWSGQSASLVKHSQARDLMTSLIAQTSAAFEETARGSSLTPP
jgi:nitronate monooxygenase